MADMRASIPVYEYQGNVRVEVAFDGETVAVMDLKPGEARILSERLARCATDADAKLHQIFGPV